MEERVVEGREGKVGRKPLFPPLAQDTASVPGWLPTESPPACPSLGCHTEQGDL